MKKVHWFTLAPTLGLLVVLVASPDKGLAQPVGVDTEPGTELYPAIALTEQPPLPSTGMAPTAPVSFPLVGGIRSIAGSSVTTENCYEPGHTQTLCFTVYNGSTDGEWLDRVRLTFPTSLGDWTVSCQSQDATDSSGYPVNLTCSNSFPYEVLYTDNDIETPNIGEITSGSSWGFCVAVTVPLGYNGPRIVNWGLSGDQDPFSAEPHDIAGTLSIEECMPLMLKPSSLVVEGCNGITQTHTFELWNNTGGDGIFNLAYNAPEGCGDFTGPSSFFMSAGETVTFTVQLEPDLCMAAGEQMTVTLEAVGNGESDDSTIVNTVTELAGWQGRTFSPIPTMDNVVVWASHQDGGLWSIGGYGAGGATQRYDPHTGTWTTHATEMSPTIEYPMDGCYGLDDQDPPHEIVVLFPDTIITGSLHVYDITADQWYTRPVPGFYPPEGRWGQDVVSLLNTPGVNQNVCYLSGGSTQTGGGRTRDLWVYHPATNSGGYLDYFPAEIWFNFHASWYVPWVGDAGSICVGGGVDYYSNVVSATHCYDLATGTFNGENADLGPLPEPWWGMADGWMVYEGRYQIWLANGVAQDGTLLPASAYADETTGGFVYGPEIPVALYRLEGDGWDGQFYAEQGAAGGFMYSTHNQLLVQCPVCHSVYLPLVLRDYY